MLIVFANQKGGVGKTKLSKEFANYTSELEKAVMVVDIDFQKSFYLHRQKDLAIFDNKPKYEVYLADAEKMENFFEDFKSVDPNTHLIIDFPGKLDDVHLHPVLINADIIICPYKYDEDTVTSTAAFLMGLQYLKSKAKIFLVPNIIKKKVIYSSRKKVDEKFATFGIICPEINDRVGVERVNTIGTTPDALGAVKETFDFIIKECGI